MATNPKSSKPDLSYQEAFSKLEHLVEQLEDGNIQLDELSLKIKQANELIRICEEKLRGIESDVQSAAKDAPASKAEKGND